MAETHQPDGTILVLAPFGKDGALMAQALKNAGLVSEVVLGVDEIAQRMGDAGAAIVTEEALDEDRIEMLGKSVASQPSWSDFPIIVLTGGGVSTPYTEMAVRSRAPMGNLTLLERPVRPATLISAVRTALRARKRQYEIRDHLDKRKAAEEELRRAHNSLEVVVEQRTAALRRLSARLMHVQDEERRRIARELHDGMGQYLTAAKIYLDMLAADDGVRDSSALKEARNSLEHAVGDIRTLSYLLHPPLLDEAGLESAIRWFVEGFVKRSGIEVSMNLQPLSERLSDAAELALFRVVQEALTNAHRHAGCKAVDVMLRVTPPSVELEVKDYGRGMPKNLVERLQKTGTASGVGLAGMRERLRELGGELEVTSDNSGTLLKCRIPMVQAKSHMADGADGIAGAPASLSLSQSSVVSS